MSDIRYPSVKVKVNGEWRELVTKAKSDNYGVVKLTDGETGIAATPEYVKSCIDSFGDDVIGESPVIVSYDSENQKLSIGMEPAAGVVMVGRPEPTSSIANNYKLYIQV